MQSVDIVIINYRDNYFQLLSCQWKIKSLICIDLEQKDKQPINKPCEEIIKFLLRYANWTTKGPVCSADIIILRTLCF